MSKNKTVFSSLAALCLISTLSAQNLVKNADFNLYPDKVGPEFRTNGGKAELHTEDLTWNRCGKLIIDKIRKSGQYDAFGCGCWIGGSFSDNKHPGGFPCKPDTTYDFSIDIKGTVDSAGISFTQWNKGQTLWHGKSYPTSVGHFKVQDQWTHYKGSFTTKPGAVHACLSLTLWGNSKYGPLKSKAGDYVLFDNIVIQERKRPSLSSQTPAPKNAVVKPMKIISADGTAYNDFHIYKKTDASVAATEFKVSMDQENFIISFVCHEPLKIMPAPSAQKLWNGDVFEVFFGPGSNDRQHTQLAVSANGLKFSSIGQGFKELPWEAKTKIENGKWSGELRIPYKSLGWKKTSAGQLIPFNAGRYRAAARELICWGNAVEGFADLANSGKLYCGSFPEGMTRAAFEAEAARKAAAAVQAKLDSVRNAKILAAPVGITDDFSLPYLPDALFNPVAKIELRAAVNEIKPLPLALMNNTDQVRSYRITVEIPKAKAPDWHNGKLFPGVTYRQGIRFRDNEQGTSAIFDPLVELGPARIVTAGPKEALLLWFDFDTAKLNPGAYEGRIRIVTLNGKGRFTKRGPGYGNLNYDGDMKDIPVKLTVNDFELSMDPAIPADFFSPAPNDSVIRLQSEAGQRIFAINPWSLKYPIRDGKMVPEAPVAEKQIEFVKSKGFNRFFIGFSCRDVFLQLYGKKNSSLWTEWIKTTGLLLKKHNIQPEKCFIEIYDEPDPKRLPDILESLKEARKANPGFKLTITLGAHIMSPVDMAKIAPLVDHWILWSYGYFSQSGHLAFINKEKKRGVTFAHYTCSTNIRTSLAREFRRNAWFGEYHRLQGNAMFIAVSSLSNCIWKGLPKGSLIYYSGDDAAQPSVRYMSVRQGMTDVKYLQKLREVGKDSPEAQAFLKTAAKRVVVDFAHDASMPDRVREEAAAMILELLEQNGKR